MAAPASNDKQTFVRARSNSGSVDFTASSGNYKKNKKLLNKLPDHPLKAHLLDRQATWERDKKAGKTFMHPPLGCAETAAMIHMARAKGWAGVEKATFGEAHEGSAKSVVLKTRCDHCQTWQTQQSKSGASEQWGVADSFKPAPPAPKFVFSQDDFPKLK